MNARWTTPEDIAARVRRRWDDGSLLRAYANGEPFDPIEVSLRGPKPSQIGDDIAAARKWVAALDAGRRDDRRYTLQWQSIGGQADRPQPAARPGGGVLDRTGLGAAGGDATRFGVSMRYWLWHSSIRRFGSGSSRNRIERLSWPPRCHG